MKMDQSRSCAGRAAGASCRVCVAREDAASVTRVKLEPRLRASEDMYGTNGEVRIHRLQFESLEKAPQVTFVVPIRISCHGFDSESPQWGLTASGEYRVSARKSGYSGSSCM